jgi:hypothetical protein
MHEAARLVEDPSKQFFCRGAVNDLKSENRDKIRHASVVLIPGDLGSASRAQKMRDLMLAKTDPHAMHAKVVWEVVLGHRSDIDKGPHEGVYASSAQTMFH